MMIQYGRSTSRGGSSSSSSSSIIILTAAVFVSVLPTSSVSAQCLLCPENQIPKIFDTENDQLSYTNSLGEETTGTCAAIQTKLLIPDLSEGILNPTFWEPDCSFYEENNELYDVCCQNLNDIGRPCNVCPTDQVVKLTQDEFTYTNSDDEEFTGSCGAIQLKFVTPDSDFQFFEENCSYYDENNLHSDCCVSEIDIDIAEPCSVCPDGQVLKVLSDDEVSYTNSNGEVTNGTCAAIQAKFIIPDSNLNFFEENCTFYEEDGNNLYGACCVSEGDLTEPCSLCPDDQIVKFLSDEEVSYTNSKSETTNGTCAAIQAKFYTPDANLSFYEPDCDYYDTNNLHSDCCVSPSEVEVGKLCQICPDDQIVNFVSQDEVSYTNSNGEVFNGTCGEFQGKMLTPDSDLNFFETNCSYYDSNSLYDACCTPFDEISASLPPIPAPGPTPDETSAAPSVTPGDATPPPVEPTPPTPTDDTESAAPSDSPVEPTPPTPTNTPSVSPTDSPVEPTPADVTPTVSPTLPPTATPTTSSAFAPLTGVKSMLILCATTPLFVGLFY